MFPAATLMLVAAGAAIAGAGKGLLDCYAIRIAACCGFRWICRRARTRSPVSVTGGRSSCTTCARRWPAIRCANGTLHRYAERLDERTKATLEDALTKELGRLEGLVDPTISHP